MELKNVLSVKNRFELREWFIKYSTVEKECWLKLQRGKPTKEDVFYYLDALEEALCFGWIDSTNKKIDGVCLQRFSPRRKNSCWTELNKERVRRLEKLNLMTEEGRKVLPEVMDVSDFKMDEEIERELKKAKVYLKFKQFHPLYQRVRAYNIAFYKKRKDESYKVMLKRLIDETKKGNMYGEWNDYGRLLNY